MLPSSNKGPSLNFGFPDVCLTPVGPVIVPIPYPNFGAHALAMPFSPVVSTAMIPALNLASIITMTTGDEPGVAHWTVTGPGFFDMGNPVVFVDMLPGINLTCPTDGNTGNDDPGMVVAPGAPNVLYTLARVEKGTLDEPSCPPPAALRASAPPKSPAPPAKGGERSGVVGTVLRAEETRAMDALLEGPPLADGAGLVTDEIGYLTVRAFSWRLAAALDLAISRLAGRGMRALVLDLRGCPGGELTSMLETAGDFLDRGAEIVTMIDAEDDRVVHRARRDGAHRLPVALLVDADTASAAELFAAALKAHGRAAIVGTPTHGKDTGQILLRDGSGRAVSMTAARFSPPATGRPVLDASHRVLPDIEADAAGAVAAAIDHLRGTLDSLDISASRAPTR